MKPIVEAWCCQIELTNHCPHNCLYCSRFNRHIRVDQRFAMTAFELENALNSLVLWPNKVGIIGGEPTVHPDFEQMCRIIQKWRKDTGKWIALWTSGGRRYEMFKTLITETFDWVAYNDHKDTSLQHQRATMASKDVVPDAALRAKLIDNCWVQRIWCPTISPGGAYFCEVAYALDTLFDHHSGWKVEPGWWKRTPIDYASQMWACQYCGMAVPMQRDSVGTPREKVSISLLHAMVKNNLRRVTDAHVELLHEWYTPEEIRAAAETWEPGNYKPGTDPGKLPPAALE